ncbi:helix-turn-helix domain-containing protein [Devosia sp. ZB163]|uniref:helix-turn-helix domain-containing protein n=1 Tax=Devosia sp. ZB163 TaxID=3025938 RepID=UPI00235E261E|nr:helix-turn-helix domain-containing protein [Devosia sp. ZB163]MDC9823508.1 helix-turn-helix domain-containing protein [Devosia sp. ZB163]
MLHYASDNAARFSPGLPTSAASLPDGEPSRPQVRLVTRGLPLRRQFEAWAEQISPIVEVSPLSDPSRGFEAVLEAWDLGELVLISAHQPAIAFRRTDRRCRSDGLDHWVLSAVRGEVAGRRGTLQFHCLSRPFEGQSTGGEAVHLCVPRDFLRRACPLLVETQGGTSVNSALGRMLADFLLDLVPRMPELDPADYPGLLGSIRAMITASLAVAPWHPTLAQKARHETVVERARRLVQEQLHSSSLSVGNLCRELGVSRSRLYRLFEPMGGVVHYIRHRRLLDAHMALADSDDRRPIVDIAAERGFIDPAEFSRAFKREFGYRPSDARGSAELRPARSPSSAPGAGTSLAGLLQGLR